METVSTPRRRWFRREAEDRALTRSTVPSVFFGDTLAGPAVSTRSAMQIADVYACVRALVDAISTLPLIAYRRTEDGRERDDGPLAQLLAAPAPGVPQYALLGHLASCLILHGDAFLGLFRDDEGRVAQLGVLDPERVSIEVRGGLPLYVVVGADGRQQTVTQRDVLHLRSPLPASDGVRGLSPIRAAREAFGVASALTKQAAATAVNDARPTGVLKVPQGANGDETLDQLATAFHARHGGPENAGRIAVLRADVSFVPISMPLADQQFVAQRELSTREIARIFRVPPEHIGADSGSSMTYANVESRNLAFVQHALRPWLVAIEQSVSGHPDLCPQGSRLYVEFLLDALLRGDSSRARRSTRRRWTRTRAG